MMWVRSYSGKQIPYKWRFECACGAGGISWSWWRRYDLVESGMSTMEYLAEQRMTEAELDTGALMMAYQHIENHKGDPE